MEVLLVLLSFEEQHSSRVSTDNDAILGQPAVTQEVLRFDLLDRVRFEVSFVVFIRFEDTVSYHAELGVVVGIKRYLEVVRMMRFHAI